MKELIVCSSRSLGLSEDVMAARSSVRTFKIELVLNEFGGGIGRVVLLDAAVA